MKKKFIVLTFVSVLSFSLISCGSTVDNTTDTTSTKIEDISVKDTEVAVVETETQVEEVATEEATEQSFVFTLDYGMEKVNMIKNAYNDLIANSTDKPVETAIIHDYKNFISGTYTGGDYQYPDGTYLSLWGEYAVGALYMNNYINNGTGYYDFSEWLNSQEDKRIMNLCGFPEDTNAEWTSDDVLMCGAFLAAEYLNSCTEITGELVESTDYTIAGIQSAYVINLTCDGKTGGTAVFDEEGHLLNILMADNSDFLNEVGATVQ